MVFLLNQPSKTTAKVKVNWLHLVELVLTTKMVSLKHSHRFGFRGWPDRIFSTLCFTDLLAANLISRLCPCIMPFGSTTYYLVNLLMVSRLMSFGPAHVLIILISSMPMSLDIPFMFLMPTFKMANLFLNEIVVLIKECLLVTPWITRWWFPWSWILPLVTSHPNITSFFMTAFTPFHHSFICNQDWWCFNCPLLHWQRQYSWTLHRRRYWARRSRSTSGFRGSISCFSSCSGSRGSLAH